MYRRRDIIWPKCYLLLNQKIYRKHTMTKILSNPVVREEDVPRHIPYGIALLASIAIDQGHNVKFTMQLLGEKATVY